MLIPFVAVTLIKRYIYATAILIGMAMGITETIMRALIADMIPIEVRGTAYGIFNLVLGFSLLVGKVVTAVLFLTPILPFYAILL